KQFPGRQDVIIHCVEGGNYPMLDGDFYSPEFKHTPDLLPPLVHLDVAAASGMTLYEGSAFGPEYRGNLFSTLFNMHKVQRHVLARDGATFRSRDEDSWFRRVPISTRPTCSKMPMGAWWSWTPAAGLSIARPRSSARV